MDCQDVQKFIHAFLDGEFAEQERILVTAHLRTCPECNRMARFEEKLRRRLREEQPKETASPQLRARVRRALEQSDPKKGGVQPWLWKLIPAGLAAALLVGGQVSGSLTKPRDSAVVGDSLVWHRQTVPMDVTGPGLAQVGNWFSDKVEFAVRPPVFKEPSTRLVGARLSNLGAHRAAYLRYQVGPQRVSVFILDPTDVALPGQPVQIGKREIYLGSRGGYNVVMYTVGGTGYVVASEMDRPSLIRLVSSFR